MNPNIDDLTTGDGYRVGDIIQQIIINPVNKTGGGIPKPPATGTHTLQAVEGVVQWVTNTATVTPTNTNGNTTTQAGNTTLAPVVSANSLFSHLINCTQNGDTFSYTSGTVEMQGGKFYGYLVTAPLVDGKSYNFVVPKLALYQLLSPGAGTSAELTAGVTIQNIDGTMKNGDQVIIAGETLTVKVNNNAVELWRGATMLDQSADVTDASAVVGFTVLAASGGSNIPSLTVTAA